MIHTRCDATVADLRARLDAAALHVQQLEADLRFTHAQLLDALKPQPQQQVTDDVIRTMLLPDRIHQAIDLVSRGPNGPNTAMAQYLSDFARQELSRGADESDIAERILHGDEEIPADKPDTDLGFIVPEQETVDASDEDEG